MPCIVSQIPCSVQELAIDKFNIWEPLEGKTIKLLDYQCEYQDMPWTNTVHLDGTHLTGACLKTFFSFSLAKKS